jgi:hypothetical protein
MRFSQKTSSLLLFFALIILFFKQIITITANFLFANKQIKIFDNERDSVTWTLVNLIAND